MATKTDRLTPPQLAAVDLLAAGATLSDTSQAIGVARQTVSEWTNNGVGFGAELKRLRRELWDEHSQRLRALVPKALDVIEAELGGERRPSAATYRPEVVRPSRIARS